VAVAIRLMIDSKFELSRWSRLPRTIRTLDDSRVRTTAFGPLAFQIDDVGRVEQKDI
jgi:hypothetical protein